MLNLALRAVDFKLLGHAKKWPKIQKIQKIGPFSGFFVIRLKPEVEQFKQLWRADYGSCSRRESLRF